MKTLLCVWGVLAIYLTAARAAESFVKTGGTFFGNVVAETTLRGASLEAPTENRPVYYALFDGGYWQGDRSLPGDKIPSAALVAESLRQALASGHFLPATVDNPATVALVYYWGDIRGTWTDRVQLALVTPAKATDMFKFRFPMKNSPNKPDAQWLAWHSPEEEEAAYRRASSSFVLVSAFDYSELSHGQLSPLWRLKLTTNDRRRTMEEAVPSMIAGSSSYFGRASPTTEYLEVPVVRLGAPETRLPSSEMATPPVIRKAVADLIAQMRAVFRGDRDPTLDDAPFLEAQSSRPPSRDKTLKPDSTPTGKTLVNVVAARTPASAEAPPANVETIQVSVVSETSQRGAQGPWPTAGAPVRYVAFDGGFIDYGPAISSVKKIPEPSLVAGSLRVALKSRGYLPASGSEVPDLVLTYHWGGLQGSFDGPGALRGLISPTARIPTARPRNLTEYQRPPELAERMNSNPGLREGNFDAFPRVVTNNVSAVYFVLVTAYDYSDLESGKATPLWRLKLSAPDSWRAPRPISEVLPTLLNAGAQYIGKGAGRRQWMAVPLVKYVGSAMPMPEKAALKEPKIISDLLASTRDWLTDKRDATPDDAAFRAAQEAEVASPGLPPALAARIASYQKEKATLQDELAQQLKGRAPGTATREAVDAFNTKHASRIAALERVREEIRAELATLVGANSSFTRDKSLDDLLREFAGDVRQAAPR